MTLNKKCNLMKMKAISESKSGYGLVQIKVEFSSSNKLSNDIKAVSGKRILREKLYSRV